MIRTHILAAETPRFYSWHRAGGRQHGSGLMSEMTGPLVEGRRQQRCSTSHAIGKWPIRTGILQGGGTFSTPKPMAATTTFTVVGVIPVPC